MYILTQQDHIGATYLAELRDLQVQQDRMRFRHNLERLGMAFGMEVSKSLDYHQVAVQTPLGTKQVRTLVSQPVLVTVMRASLPLYQGFLQVFDKADTAFIGAYRGAHKSDNSFDIALDYIASPSLDGRVLILLDPMIATGKSLVQSYQSLLQYGKPSRVLIVAAIAAQAGLDYLAQHLPEAELWVGDVDAELNDHSYIIPGLGDAGDLSFGPKL